jgi:Ca2+-binding RTX toxin-like protein
LILFALVSESQAADCGAPDAPPAYSSATCNSVCTYTNDAGADTITCNVPVSGKIWSASDFSATAHDYSFWGYDATLLATKFCCTFNETADEVDSIQIYGNASGAEFVRLNAGGGPGGKFLHNPLGSTTTVPAVTVYVWAGNDTIEGSPATDIGQTFYGGDGDDDIYCFNQSYVIAGDGDDYIVGSPEDDELRGGTGSDYIAGGDGDDILEAGPFGDPTDVNYLCGDVGADDMYGDSYQDYLWGGDDYDYAVGGSGYETCDGEDVHDCDVTTMASRPSQCP